MNNRHKSGVNQKSIFAKSFNQQLADGCVVFKAFNTVNFVKGLKIIYAKAWLVFPPAFAYKI